MLAQCSIPVPRENFGNQSFPNVFSGYRNGVSGKNGLIDVQQSLFKCRRLLW